VAHQLPPTHAQLEARSDADLVALARGQLGDGDLGLETAKRCVALVYERHRGMVRALCAAKAAIDAVDDLEGAVYERFVRAAYLGREPMTNPAGLLVTMTRRVIASHHARRPPQTAPLDELAEAGTVDDGYDDLAATEVVEQLLATLTERQREAVWLRVQEGLPSGEVAARLETTPGNVDVMVFRALRRLRGVLER
jgi:RNA polymerase sigma factor (sigma-70 family)